MRGGLSHSLREPFRGGVLTRFDTRTPTLAPIVASLVLACESLRLPARAAEPEPAPEPEGPLRVPHRDEDDAVLLFLAPPPDDNFEVARTIAGGSLVIMSERSVGSL